MNANKEFIVPFRARDFEFKRQIATLMATKMDAIEIDFGDLINRLKVKQDAFPDEFFGKLEDLPIMQEIVFLDFLINLRQRGFHRKRNDDFLLVHEKIAFVLIEAKIPRPVKREIGIPLHLRTRIFVPGGGKIDFRTFTGLHADIVTGVKTQRDIIAGRKKAVYESPRHTKSN